MGTTRQLALSSSALVWQVEVDSALRTTDPTRKGIEALVLETPQPLDPDTYPSVLRDGLEVG